MESYPWEAVAPGVWAAEARAQQWRMTRRRGWIEGWLIPEGWEDLEPLSR